MRGAKDPSHQHLHWEWALANRSVRVSTRTSSPNKLLSVALSARFATDSPLEGEGFEPSVPLAKEPRFRPLTRASKDGQSTCRGPGPPAQRKTFTSAPRISLVVQTSSGGPPSESAD